MTIIYYFVGVFAVLLTYFTTLFIVAQKLKNNSIVDIGWGLWLRFSCDVLTNFYTPQWTWWRIRFS